MEGREGREGMRGRGGREGMGEREGMGGRMGEREWGGGGGGGREGGREGGRAHLLQSLALPPQPGVLWLEGGQPLPLGLQPRPGVMSSGEGSEDVMPNLLG